MRPLDPEGAEERVHVIGKLLEGVGAGSGGALLLHRTGGVQAETRQVLNNIRDILAGCGAKLEHVVRCTVYLPDAADFIAMNEVYAEFFEASKPARTTIVAITGTPALPAAEAPGTGATSDGKPWVFYFTDTFVQRCLAMIDQVFAGLGAFVRRND